MFTGNRKIDRDPNIIGSSTISEFKVGKVYKGEAYENIISVLKPLNIIDSKHDKIKLYQDYNEIDYWAIDEFEAIVEKGYLNRNTRKITITKK